MTPVKSINTKRGHMNKARKGSFEEDWYLKSFGDDFAQIYNHKNETAREEVAAVLRYAQLPEKIEEAPAIAVLDLGCGWGRHALEFAARGYDVTGIDTSDVLLQIARKNAEKVGLKLRLINADMRSFSLPNKVRLAVNLWTSFGYFSDDEENQAVLKNVWNVMEPGGIFILDLDNLPYFLRTTGAGVITINSGDGKPIEALKSEEYEPGRSRRIVRYRFLDPNKAAGVEGVYLECRLYQYEDIRQALIEAGFRVNSTQKWGDFRGGTLTQNSPRMIVRANKP